MLIAGTVIANNSATAATSSPNNTAGAAWLHACPRRAAGPGQRRAAPIVNSRVVMQLRYKTPGGPGARRQPGAPGQHQLSPRSLSPAGAAVTQSGSGNPRRGKVGAGGSDTPQPQRPLYSLASFRPVEMDFILPASVPAGGIQWEKVLPPLIPRLNGTYGQYKWSPKLLMPETDSSSPPEVNCDDSGFTVKVDVKDFSPKDLMVKVTGDFVEVQGKHEEKKKDGPGFTTRQFSRRYRIPKGVHTMALESAVSPDGILIISAPMLQNETSLILNGSH